MRMAAELISDAHKFAVAQDTLAAKSSDDSQHWHHVALRDLLNEMAEMIDSNSNTKQEMSMTKISHTFERMSEDMRPQDPNMNGDGLTFETLEHGGEFPDTMPQAIKVTDVNGKWCIYHPTKEAGHVVQSHGFNLSV